MSSHLVFIPFLHDSGFLIGNSVHPQPMERELLRAKRAGSRSAWTEQDRPWSLPSRLRGRASLQWGVPSARMGGSQRRALQSLIPREEERHQNAKYTLFLKSLQCGSASPPPAWRERGRRTRRTQAALPTWRGALRLSLRPVLQHARLDRGDYSSRRAVRPAPRLLRGDASATPPAPAGVRGCHLPPPTGS